VKRTGNLAMRQQAHRGSDDAFSRRLHRREAERRLGGKKRTSVHVASSAGQRAAVDEALCFMFASAKAH
jgi:hypothetical protein